MIFYSSLNNFFFGIYKTLFHHNPLMDIGAEIIEQAIKLIIYVIIKGLLERKGDARLNMLNNFINYHSIEKSLKIEVKKKNH